MGNAVQRNRAKRLLREAIRPHLPAITPGWDVILIARAPMAGAAFQDIQLALNRLLHQARLLNPPDGQNYSAI